MPSHCRQCGESDFRTSKFQPFDLAHLFVLQLPVRCMNCYERSFAFFPQFFRLRREHRDRKRQRANLT